MHEYLESYANQFTLVNKITIGSGSREDMKICLPFNYYNDLLLNSHWHLYNLLFILLESSKQVLYQTNKSALYSGLKMSTFYDITGFYGNTCFHGN